MDSADVVGNNGLLHLLKKNGRDVLTRYPIDGASVTIGRSQDCDLRLYFETVSGFHCRLIFDEERKAYLEVHSPHGVVVDGCSVVPSSGGAPAVVPLSNNTRFTVAHKQFIFQYPPKEIRAQLFASPRPSPEKTRRALRVSMIETAQVFSPLRNISSPADALKSPLKPRIGAVTPREEPEVVLVDGDVEDIIVLDEEQELTILEEVNVAPAVPESPNRSRQSEVFRTPPPKSRPKSFNLHKAVLLRSAQKAAVRKEEEMEEEEVELAVSPERELGYGENEGDLVGSAVAVVCCSKSSRASSNEYQPESKLLVSPIRTGFDTFKNMFMRSPEKTSTGPVQDAMLVDVDDEPSMQIQTPKASRVATDVNPFFTPPPAEHDQPGDVIKRTGPQRVRVVDAWRISDIHVLPSPIKPTLALPAPPAAAAANSSTEEDAHTLIERTKGQMSELRRKSLAREARHSIGNTSPVRSRPPVAPGFSTPSHGASLPVKDEPVSEIVPAETQPPQSESRSHLYPDIPVIDFSRPRSPKKSTAGGSSSPSKGHRDSSRALHEGSAAAPSVPPGLFNIASIPTTSKVEATVDKERTRDDASMAGKPRTAASSKNMLLSTSGSSVDDIDPPRSDDTGEEEVRKRRVGGFKPSRTRAPPAATATAAAGESSRIARPTRTRVAPSSEAEVSSDASISVPSTKPARTTRTRAPTPAVIPTRATRRVKDEPVDNLKVPAPPTKASSRRVAVGTSLSAEKENDESSAQESSSSSSKAATARKRVVTGKTTETSGSDTANRVTRSRARK
ncbi:hypothetical protein BKA62DRAFT_753718 [Auriculariales sp. MPI-PUGE-AT-0066]|nr:hypothetical protein BKA62DRAFT_753718 [Auriculariales sp. MPI-PUGE-AT-0066]